MLTTVEENINLKNNTTVPVVIIIPKSDKKRNEAYRHCTVPYGTCTIHEQVRFYYSTVLLLGEKKL